MFAFSQAKPYIGGIRTQPKIPLGEYLGVAFEQGIHDSMFNSLSSSEELRLLSDEVNMTTEEANKKYGVGTLRFDRSINESQAKLLNERKVAEMRRQYYLSQGNPGGLFSGRGIAGIGAGFLGSVTNPLDFSVNFLPIVGSEAAAARLAGRGAASWRQSMARGLVTTEEALARSLPVAPRLTSSLIQGAVGNLTAEIPHVISEFESKADYTLQDAAVNVVAGTVLSGALHLAVTGAARIFDRLSAPTKEVMFRKAVDDFAKGQDIRTEQFVHVDPEVIRAKVRFDEVAARELAVKNLDMVKVVEAVNEKFGEKVTHAAARLSDGSIKTGKAHWAIEGVDPDLNVEWGFLTDKGRFISRDEAGQLMGMTYGDEDGSGLVTAESLGLVDPGSLSYRDQQRIEKLKEHGLSDKDALAMFVQQREQAILTRLAGQVATEKELQIKQFIDNERAKWDEEGRFTKEMRAEMDNQIAEGKTLTPEQIKEWNFVDPDKTEASLKEQSTQLKKDLDELMEEIGQVEEPAIKQELLDTAERTKKNIEAVEQAIVCIIANLS